MLTTVLVLGLIEHIIDVVLDKVIWTVNWLHYLNYEPIDRTSSIRNLVHTRNVFGHTTCYFYL